MDVRQELLRRFAAPLPEYYTRRIVVFKDDQGGFAADQQDVFYLFHKLAPYFTELYQSMTDRRFSGQTALAPLVAMS